MINNEKVCRPGFNDCEQPKNNEGNREVIVTNPDVCLPGFNNCGVSENPNVTPVAGKDGACLPGFNACAPAAGSEVPAKDEFDKEILNTDKTVLLYFSAPWCTHCQAFSPIIDEIAAENAGTVALAKIDIDAQPKIAEKFNIVGVPTLIVVQDKKIVDTVVGGRTREAIQELLELNKANEPANEENVCLPGFNGCEEPKTREVKIIDPDVCKPGFNSCGVTESPEPNSSGCDGGTCKPGFNSCN